MVKYASHVNAESAWPTPGVLVLIAVAFGLVWLTSWHADYGYFLDELDYLACARRLAFGYVDHPPLAPFVLAVNSALLGDSLPALRLLPAACGAGTAFLAARMAKQLGAGRFGQLLAALCVSMAILFVGIFSIFSTNCFEVLLWTAIFSLLLQLSRDGSDRRWRLIGAFVGLAILTKHTSVALAAAIGLALVASPLRWHLLGARLWLGVGIAALLVLPNLWWQLQHDWASLWFYVEGDRQSNVTTSVLGVLGQQIGSFNPAAFPVWGAGLWFLLVSRRGEPYRLVGWTVALLFAALLIAGKSRPDRIMGVYPVLFAAGAVQLESLIARRHWSWVGVALPAGIVLVAALVAPTVLPILGPHAAADYLANVIGDQNDIQREVGTAPLLLPLAHRMGSEELVDLVSRVHADLPPARREGAVILASGYAGAGALELLGGADLPPVYSPHVTYYFWGPPPTDSELVITVGYEPEQLAAYFERIDVVERAPCEYCMGWRQDVPIALATGPRRSLREAWPELRLYAMQARKLYLLRKEGALP